MVLLTIACSMQEREIAEYLSIARKKSPPKNVQAYLEIVGYVLHVRKLIVTGVKEGALPGKAAEGFALECDALLQKRVEQAPPMEKRVYPAHRATAPRDTAPRETLGLHVAKKVQDTVRIENEMLEMTGGMKEVANIVWSTIRRDLHALESVADSQQTNLDKTRRENEIAKNVRASKRLSFFATALMILASAAIFLALIPLMIVT